jgi:DNA polymerase IV (DinB-like DNA polymerase)
LPQRVVLHIDLDYFYAQCEENLNHAIRGKPVVVCVYSGRTEESGVVSTCNYEARKYGVKAGIPITRARKLLEALDAVFLPMNRPRYEEVSDRIMEIIEPFGDSFEKAGVDEAYVDLTSKTTGDFRQAEKIAHEIKQRVLAEEEITCTIGVAPNKLLAKIASDRNKPNGLTVVTPEDVSAFLADLSVNKIPGVGKKTEEELDKLKVKTVDQLASLNVSVLHETFGNSLATYLYRAARGEDDEPVRDREQPTQFSRIATLKRNTHEASEILPILKDLANSVTGKLIEKAMTCKTVSIIAILGDLSIHSKSRTFDSPTYDQETIAQTSADLIEQFLQSDPGALVRRVGVKVSGLSARSGQTDISKFLVNNS